MPKAFHLWFFIAFSFLLLGSASVAPNGGCKIIVNGVVLNEPDAFDYIKMKCFIGITFGFIPIVFMTASALLIWTLKKNMIRNRNEVLIQSRE